MNSPSEPRPPVDEHSRLLIPNLNPEQPADQLTRRQLARFATIPNLLSISRLFLLPVILLLLQSDQSMAALVLMVISWLTDGLDGYFARRLHQVTTLGKILDHLVDKIWVGTILVMLVATRGLPVFIAAAVISRDLLIVLGSILILDIKRQIMSSNIIGKATGFVFAVLMLLYVIDPPAAGARWLPLARTVVLWVVTAMVAVSFINYVLVYLRVMRRQGNSEPA